MAMLTVDESDRAASVARVLVLAEGAFGSRDKAHRWLHRNSAALGDRKPIDLFRTDAGARVVESLLARIAWGAGNLLIRLDGCTIGAASMNDPG